MSSADFVIVYWATVLDNALRGYDAATHSFSKDGLPFLKFRDRCYFVTEKELPLAIEKAKHIASSVAKRQGMMPAICVIKAQFPQKELFINDRGGFGMFRLGSTFPVSAFFLVVSDRLQPFPEEELLLLQKRKGGKL